MQLSALLTNLPDTTGPAEAAPDPEIVGITADSRAVRPGMLFAALAGANADGARFIPAAVAAGAVAVLTGNATSVDMPGRVAVVRAADPRRALALLAARMYAPQPDCIVAVTGTNGKTSVADFTRQLFSALGHRSASLGTLGLVRADGAVYGSLTTPDPVSMHQTLAELAQGGVTHVALEASSHGLDQRRLDGVRLAAGAFTNLGRDHLDYHATLDDYLAAKLRLFDTLLEAGRPAVIDADGARAGEVAAAAQQRGLQVATVGRVGETLRLLTLEADGFTQRFTVEHQGRQYVLGLPMIGAYQVSNALVAAGLAIATGNPAEAALAAIPRLLGVSGRLETVGEANGGLVVVDYAHKPEALAAALGMLRPFASGRLICVLGCGGDRDKGKRPIMGRIGADKADVVIVTDDNPRSEDPATIRAEVLAGAQGALEIGDRAEAIDKAIAMLQQGDVVLIAGKGHETGQIIGNRTLPFSDRDVARVALARREQ